VSGAKVAVLPGVPQLMPSSRNVTYPEPCVVPNPDPVMATVWPAAALVGFRLRGSLRGRTETTDGQARSGGPGGWSRRRIVAETPLTLLARLARLDTATVGGWVMWVMWRWAWSVSPLNSTS